MSVGGSNRNQLHTRTNTAQNTGQVTTAQNQTTTTQVTTQRADVTPQVTPQRVPATAAQVEGTRARATAGDRLAQAQLQARLGGQVAAQAPAAAAGAPETPRTVGVVSPGALETTGATRATASQDKIKQGGVEASQQMAANDQARISRMKTTIEETARKYNVDPSIVAGIISRETRGGAMLDANGYGRSDPNGFGVMQVDKNNHTPVGTPSGRDHIEQGVKIFAGFRNQIANAHPDWTDAQITKAAISAYNKGPATLTRASADPARTDRGTTGGDYANDVIARAQYFQQNLFAPAAQ